MATESFFYHIKFTNKDERELKQLIEDLILLKNGYEISQEDLQKIKEKEKKSEKVLSEWIKNL